MNQRSLEALPFDLLTLISTALHGSHPESLRAFAAVNRKFHDVAAPLMYRHLIITTMSPQHLIQDVTDLVSTQRGRRFLKHARILELRGHMMSRRATLGMISSRGRAPSNNDQSEIEPGPEYRPFKAAPLSWSIEKSLNQGFDEVWFCDAPTGARQDLIAAWTPLTSMLAKFQHLSDLVFSRSDMFPPGLLDGVTTSHPTCRIHLHAFRFKSLHEEVTNADERALAISPNLHSIGLITSMSRDGRGLEDYNREALLETVSHAPNLQHVRVMGCRPVSSPALATSMRKPWRPWKGFVPPLENARQARLLSLSWEVYESDVNLQKLEQWRRHADFSALTRMKFRVSDVAVLRYLTEQHELPAIRHLDIHLEERERNATETSKADVEDFFTSLPPLESLKLSGVLNEELVRKVCERHGETLQTLAVKPRRPDHGSNGELWMLTGENVDLFCATCPSLEHLSLTIKRSMADQTETRCYERLATIRTLRSVKLQMDCTNPRINGRMGGMYENEDDIRPQTNGATPIGRQSHLRRALVNSAVDETLARSIWDIISSNNSKLEWLEIRPYGGDRFGPVSTYDLAILVNNLSRSYRLSRKVGNNVAADDCDIIELSKQHREQSDQHQREHERNMLDKWGKSGIQEATQAEFDSLWPPLADGENDWRKRWRSWPLQRNLEMVA